MKLLFDFFPIILFFITFKMYADPREGVLAATAVVIVATIVQVAATWAWKRRVERMHLITLALVCVFGGATLLLQDELFIKWKPTVANWLFALVFLGSQFIGRASISQRVMENAVQLPATIWTRVNLLWVGFFAFLGVLNLYVVYSFDTETWVNFKLFGMLGLTVLFLIAQGFYISRHALPEEPGEEAK